MSRYPKISIVTPSFNQGRYIGETLQSLVDQNYPELEVIIQDGGSKDESVDVARSFVERHPHIFKLFVEKDRGQSHALNMGFSKTTGEILGFLNSDDTLYPGCLHRVAKEISPERNRHVVFGRSLFTGEGSVYVGLEHPAEFPSRFEFLAIWKRGYNTLPQPSVFWHRKVYETCGGLDETEQHALDYDLFCRYSKRFDFHRIDELWSTYRMHPVSKSAMKTEAEVLQLTIQVSRKHWGPRYLPLYWRCALSYRAWKNGSHDRACHHARSAEVAYDNGRPLLAVAEALATFRYSPTMFRRRLLTPLLGDIGLAVVAKKAKPAAERFKGRHSDLWIGPEFETIVETDASHKEWIAVFEHHASRAHDNFTVKVFIDGERRAERKVKGSGQFFISAPLAGTKPGRHTIRVLTSKFFNPALLSKANGDNRDLALKLLEFHAR